MAQIRKVESKLKISFTNKTEIILLKKKMVQKKIPLAHLKCVSMTRGAWNFTFYRLYYSGGVKGTRRKKRNVLIISDKKKLLQFNSVQVAARLPRLPSRFERVLTYHVMRIEHNSNSNIIIVVINGEYLGEEGSRWAHDDDGLLEIKFRSFMCMCSVSKGIPFTD